MSQNSFQQLRQNFSRQRRREELQKRFSQKRRELSIQIENKQRQRFQYLLPRINLENYEENRFLLSDYAKSSQFSYEMLPFVSLAYEYVLSNPRDGPSWEILSYLSYYEDFQIPQSQQFASKIIQFFTTNPQLASQFILNITKLSKCSLLCCRLVDNRLIESIAEIVSHTEEFYSKCSLQSGSGQFIARQNLELQLYNLLTSLSYLFTLQPTLEIDYLQKICQILNLPTKSNKFLKDVHSQAIFRLIENVIESVVYSQNILELLIYQFQESLCNSFFVYQKESIIFMNICVRNRILLSQRLLKNLFVSVRSKNNKNKVLALQLLQKIFFNFEKTHKMEVQQPKTQGFNKIIEINTLPSFQQFTLMLNSTKSDQKTIKKAQKNQHQNRLIAYSLLFTQKYETQINTLYQIYENSGQKIQQQIVILIKNIIKCLISQFQNYHPKRLVEGMKQIFITEDMENFLQLTIQKQQFYFFLSECLKSKNKTIIFNALEVLRDVFFYLEESSKLQEMEEKIDLRYFVNQCRNFKIYSALEDLSLEENLRIRDCAEDLIEMINDVDQ